MDKKTLEIRLRKLFDDFGVTSCITIMHFEDGTHSLHTKNIDGCGLVDHINESVKVAIMEMEQAIKLKKGTS